MATGFLPITMNKLPNLPTCAREGGYLESGGLIMSTEPQTCTIVAINNAGRPGLNRLYTKYYRLTTNWPSTSVENPLQISSFMQNKANLPDDQMNVTTFLTKDYENKIAFGLRKNKPNTKPNKANLPDDQMNVTIYITKEYENKSNWTLRENKANTKPIQSQTNPIPPPPNLADLAGRR